MGSTFCSHGIANTSTTSNSNGESRERAEALLALEWVKIGLPAEEKDSGEVFSPPRLAHGSHECFGALAELGPVAAGDDLL